MPSLDTITLLLTQYGYLILFPVAILEGPIITVIGGFLASQNIFNPFILFGVVVLADLAGDILFYAVGRWGKGIISRYFALSVRHIETLAKHFKAKGGRTIILGKITHSAGFAVLIAAGSAEMPMGEFLWYNILGTIPKSLVFLLIGYFFGSAYSSLNGYIEKASIVIFFLIVTAALYYLYVHKKRRNA